MRNPLTFLSLTILLFALGGFVLLADPSPERLATEQSEPPSSPSWQQPLEELNDDFRGIVTPCDISMCPDTDNWLTYRNDHFGLKISFPYDYWAPSEILLSPGRLYFSLGTPPDSPFFFREIAIWTPDSKDPFDFLLTQEWLTSKDPEKHSQDIQQKFSTQVEIHPVQISLNDNSVLYVARGLRYTDGIVEGRALYSPSTNLVLWAADTLLSYSEGENYAATESITDILNTVEFSTQEAHD